MRLRAARVLALACGIGPAAVLAMQTARPASPGPPSGPASQQKLSALDEAWALVGKGDRDGAIQIASRLVAEQPNNAGARLLLGSLLTENGRLDEAIEHLTRAVQLRPQSADAHEALGEALRAARRATAARAEFAAATKLNPRLAIAHEYLAEMMMETGDVAAAGPPLDRALALYGKDDDTAPALYLRAKVRTHRGAVREAAADLTAAVTKRPEFAEAWADLGDARKTLGDAAGALEAYGTAASLDPENAVSQSRYGNELLKQGRAADAVAPLKKAVGLDPANQTALFSLQLALRKTGQVEEAARIKEQLATVLRQLDEVSQRELEAVRLNNEGAALEKAGQRQQAIEKYTRALELNPNHNGIRINLGAALLQTGESQKGLALLREALQKEPDNARLRAAYDQAAKNTQSSDAPPQ